MPTQHTVSGTTNIGGETISIEVIDPSRTNVPPGIRSGYEYQCTKSAYLSMITDVRVILDLSDSKCQHTILTNRTLKYGFRFGVAVLTYAERGMTPEAFKALVSDLQTTIQACLGPDATLYVKLASESGWKDQIDFEAKIEIVGL